MDKAEKNNPVTLYRLLGGQGIYIRPMMFVEERNRESINERISVDPSWKIHVI